MWSPEGLDLIAIKANGNTLGPGSLRVSQKFVDFTFRIPFGLSSFSEEYG